MEGKRFVGIDLGKRSYQACVKSSDGSIERWTGKTDCIGRRRLANRLQRGDVVAMEAGFVAFPVARELLLVEGVQVVVLNPGKLAVIYASMKKTDKEDALSLARLIETMPIDYLPVVPLPSMEEEEMRRLSSGQVFLKHERTRLINHLHALFVSSGITTIPKRTLARDESRCTAVEQLHGTYQRLAREVTLILAEVERQIVVLNEEVREKLSERSDDTQFLFSIPGVGPVTVAAYLGYVGNGSRFANAPQVSYYTGMVPRIDSSSETIHLGHITKAGAPTIRRALIQAAWAAVRSPSGKQFKVVFDRIAAARGKGIAIVAVARRILELMYTLLRRREFYRYSDLGERLRKLRRYKIALNGTGRA